MDKAMMEAFDELAIESKEIQKWLLLNGAAQLYASGKAENMGAAIKAMMRTYDDTFVQGPEGFAPSFIPDMKGDA